MKIFTTETIRQIGEASIKAEGISTLDMVEREAAAAAYEIMSRWRPSKRIYIFAGPGNNGADALAVSRLLHDQGYKPTTYLFNTRNSHLTAACSVNRERLLQVEGADFNEIERTFEPPELTADDVVVDGLFGTGLSAPLTGGYKSLVQLFNESEAFVVSLDIPSGLFGEWNTGNDRRYVVKASLTLCYQYPRLSFYFAENAEHIGEVVMLDLDLNKDGELRPQSDFYLIERRQAKRQIVARDPYTQKYDYGTVLLVAGSYGMMGAAVLAARGAMRAGAGLVTVHAPRCGYDVIQTAVPEVLFEPDESQLVSSLIETKRRYSVVAIGPGISTSPETVDAIDVFLKRHKGRIILDADALNCISMRPQLLNCIPRGSIITPSAIEFDRLFGHHDTDEERLKKAIDMSRRRDLTIVLKGHHTMTVRPNGKVFINDSGNAGMSTAGSGDVLTGVIAGLLAQGYASDTAVVLAVYIHGLAGDLAAEEHSEFGVMAGDIADGIGRAFRALSR